jgi:hypothetical protein
MAAMMNPTDWATTFYKSNRDEDGGVFQSLFAHEDEELADIVAKITM